MASESILLTGETGFLGKSVRARLDRESELDVRVLDKRLGELTAEDRFDVDVVIHLAASVRKDIEAVNVEDIVDSNVVGLIRLLRCLERPRRLLFASTTDVYGEGNHEESHEGVSESAMLDPVTEYAASKLLGERIVSREADVRGYECTAMRLGHLYGPGEEGFQKFVPTTIRELMRGRPPTVFGDGETRRDLLYVDDAAEAICRLVKNPTRLPGIVNVASSQTYTTRQIAETLVDIVGFIGRIRYFRDRPNPASQTFDTRLLGETVGELDEITLREGLSREVEHVVALERDAARVVDRV